MNKTFDSLPEEIQKDLINYLETKKQDYLIKENWVDLLDGIMVDSFSTNDEDLFNIQMKGLRAKSGIWVNRRDLNSAITDLIFKLFDIDENQIILPENIGDSHSTLNFPFIWDGLTDETSRTLKIPNTRNISYISGIFCVPFNKIIFNGTKSEFLEKTNSQRSNYWKEKEIYCTDGKIDTEIDLLKQHNTK